MIISFKGKEYDVDGLKCIGEGREGIVYTFSDSKLDCAIKIFNDDSAVKKQGKIITLIDKFSKIDNSVKNNVAYPVEPVFKTVNGEMVICGFSMPDHSDCQHFFRLFYDLNEGRYSHELMDDFIAYKIVKHLFNNLCFVHRLKINIGDVRPSNILCKILRPDDIKAVFIDIDSVQADDYFSETTDEKYRDRLSLIEGDTEIVDNPRYIYSRHSDIVSLTYICFECLIGLNPFVFFTVPIVKDKKSDNLSILHFVENNLNRIGRVELADDERNRSILTRLELIRNKFPDLYRFFVDIIVNEQRKYFSDNGEDILYHDNPVSQINHSTSFSMYEYSKKDPVEFKIFANSYKLITGDNNVV